MFLIDWYRSFLEIKHEFKSCKTCIALQGELARLERENERLLNRLLEPAVVNQEVTKEELKPIQPRKHIPWSAQRQVLEANDRALALRRDAQLREQALRPSTEKLTVEELEKELDIQNA